jgi:hypothetical protein
VAAQREPPLWLLPAGLLFWGLHTGLWWLAAPLALLAVLPAWRGWRFSLAPRERRRVADLCTVLVLLAGTWLLLNQTHLGTALVRLIQWLPGLLFPLLAVQLYAAAPGLEAAVLLPSLRRRGGGRPGADVLVDLRWPYLLLCVLAAAMVPPPAPWFLPSLALLAGAALPSWLPARQHRGPVLAGSLVAALALALALAAGIRAGHDAAEQAVLAWMERWLGVGLDPYRATTAIGDVGRLKSSGRILLRVYPDAPPEGTLLLRTASYDRYVDGTWFTTGSPFTPVPDATGRRPLLADGAGSEASPAAVGAGTRIVMLLRRAEGLLPLPQDTVLVTGLEDRHLARNDYGTLRYSGTGGAPLLNYRAHPAPVGARASLSAPPGPADLRLHGPDAPAIEALATELGLADLPPADALRALERHFASRFRYTLDLPATPAGVGPLTHFLTSARAGHCEYFATAAVLTLRAAGIPARYVRGWSVQEYSELEGAWIARDHHAHAWVEAHVDGRWQTLDPTPPEWVVLEAAERPWTQQIGDFLGWLRLSLSGAAAEDPRDRDWLLLPLALLVLLLAWRIVRRVRRGGGTDGKKGLPTPATTSQTPFAAVERTAARHGHGRQAHETLLEWARRLRREGVPAAAILADAVALHYRSRFDPAGIDQPAQHRLRGLLDHCLSRWRQAKN